MRKPSNLLAKLEDQIPNVNRNAAERDQQIANPDPIVAERGALRATQSEVFSSRSWRLIRSVRMLGTKTKHLAWSLLRISYSSYIHLPLPLRMRLRSYLAPVRRRIQARLVNLSGAGPLPFDYTPHIREISGRLSQSIEFTLPQHPVGTVIVLIVGGTDATLQCLAALATQSGISAWTVAVAGRKEEIRSLEKRLYGVSWIEREHVSGISEIAARVQGHLLLMLSTETKLLPGALDELTKVIDPARGIVVAVPQLLGWDGRLAYLLSTEWGSDPNHPYNAHMMPLVSFPRSAFLADWEALWSAQSTSVTSWLDDITGLTANVRRMGKSVVLQPLAGALITPAPQSPPLSPLVDRGPRVLILDLYTPTPDMDSGSVDAFYQMQLLLDLGYQVTFAPVMDFQYQPRYTSDLQRIGVRCLYQPYVPSVEQHLISEGARYNYVVISRLPTAEGYFKAIRRHCPNAKIFFNTVDLHYLRESRQAEVEANAALARQALRTKRVELEFVAKADACWVISRAEEELLRREVPNGRIHYLPLTMEITDREAVPFAERRDIFFIGGFRHRPNLDAVTYFIQEIWPRVKHELPGARFHVVGSHPPQELIDMATEDVVIAGFVPEAAHYFNRCRLSVAPLRFGAGLKGKVGRSLGYGCPVVATPVAVEGSGLSDSEVVIAEGTDEFAAAVVRLYQDESLWNRLSVNSLAFFTEHYSLASARKRLASIFAG